MRGRKCGEVREVSVVFRGGRMLVEIKVVVRRKMWIDKGLFGR